jgi:hypothetical protein
MATGRDGIAQPAQLPRSSTPNGRGRSTVASRTTSRTARKEPTNTSRWRKRRNTSSAITVAQRNASTVPTDPVEATIASMRPVTPGRRSPASHRTTASSHTVTATPRPRRAGPKVILTSVMSTTAAATHHTPVGWIPRGRGGGAPVGRRRRRDRRTSGSPGRAGPTLPGSAGRGVDSICPSCNQATNQSTSGLASTPTRSKSTDHDPAGRDIPWGTAAVLVGPAVTSATLPATDTRGRRRHTGGVGLDLVSDPERVLRSDDAEVVKDRLAARWGRQLRGGALTKPGSTEASATES